METSQADESVAVRLRGVIRPPSPVGERLARRNGIDMRRTQYSRSIAGEPGKLDDSAVDVSGLGTPSGHEMANGQGVRVLRAV